MGMCRDLALEQRHKFRPARLSQIVKTQARSLARMHRRRPLQIGKSEIRLSISAISRAEQRKERGVLAYGQELAVTQGPTGGSKVPRKDSDFGYKWVRHIQI